MLPRFGALNKVNFDFVDGTPCCLKALAVEEGFNSRFISRGVKRVSEDRSPEASSGGNRIRGVFGLSADEHASLVSTAREHVSAWFEYQKITEACIPPNEEGGGIYQIDRIEYSEYYTQYRNHMTDVMGLEETNIVSMKVWHDVWKKQHPDLVMRVHKNVDTKDKVSRFVACSVGRLHFNNDACFTLLHIL
jgi:hypothetical protein